MHQHIKITKAARLPTAMPSIVPNSSGSVRRTNQHPTERIERKENKSEMGDEKITKRILSDSEWNFYSCSSSSWRSIFRHEWKGIKRHQHINGCVIVAFFQTLRSKRLWSNVNSTSTSLIWPNLCVKGRWIFYCFGFRTVNFINLEAN